MSHPPDECLGQHYEQILAGKSAVVRALNIPPSVNSLP